MTGNAAMILGCELPEARTAGAVDSLVAAARRAEAAGLDFTVLADRPAARPEGAGPPASLIAASVLAVHTSRIGLVMNAAPAYYEPYNLARMVASLDHISGGRAGWQVITGPDAAADANHRRQGVDPAQGRDARIAEFVPLVRDLWDTWEDGAFLHDQYSGRFIDGDRVHVLNHEGPALRVRGPLNVIRPPQGHPVVFAAAADPLVADAADVLTTGDPDQATPSPAADGESRRVLGTVTTYVAETRAAARELYARSGAVPASNPDGAVVVGDDQQVAQRLIDWFDRGVVAGFTVQPAVPGQLEAFAELVMPRLRATGRLLSTYQGATLRGNLRLARPVNRVAGRAAAADGAERN